MKKWHDTICHEQLNHIRYNFYSIYENVSYSHTDYKSSKEYRCLLTAMFWYVTFDGESF